MPVIVKSPQVSGQEPAIDDGPCRQFGVVQIVRHHRLAVSRNLPDPVRIGIQHPQFDPGQGLAYGIGAKWLQIVDGKHRASLGETVAIRDRNSQIIKKLQRGRFHERPAGKHR